MNATLEKVAFRPELWRKFVAGYQSVLATAPETFSDYCAKFRERWIAGSAVSIILFVFASFFASGITLLGQEPDMETMASAQAQQILRSLIPQGKKFTTISLYVARNNVKDVNLGMHCSSSSSAKTSGSVDDQGVIDATTHGNGSSDCRELHRYYYTTYLGFHDPVDPKFAYMLSVQCVEKFVWNHCEMPPEKTTWNMVLEVGKHDSFDIYVGTQQKLGGKTKVAKFSVIDVTHVDISDGKPSEKKEE